MSGDVFIPLWVLAALAVAFAAVCVWFAVLASRRLRTLQRRLDTPRGDVR